MYASNVASMYIRSTYTECCMNVVYVCENVAD